MIASAECAEWVARGRTHQWEGRPVDAMLCFRRAIRADPRSADPHFELGEVFWQFGRADDALAAWREAARLNPAFLAAWQALAEALLAIGNATEARAAAEQVLSLAPGNTRAELIAAIARMMDDGAAADPSLAAAIDAALQREPALAGVATLSGSLAVALDRTPPTPERGALLARLAGTPELLTRMPLLLVALAVEHTADASAPEAKTQQAAVLAAVRSRSDAAPDVEALRRIAVAVARFDRAAADEIATRHAMLCAASMTPPVPLVWPRRTAGDATRVLVLATGMGNESAAIDAIANLASDSFAVTVAGTGAPRDSLPPGVAQWILPTFLDVAAAKAIAALDVDVLIDAAGLAAATGPLLAQHPARQVWTIAALPHMRPLVDRAFGDVDMITDALRELHRARDATGECPLGASAMAGLWTESLRAHQQGNRAAALEGYARVLALQPGFAPAHYLSGVAQREEGADAAARAAFAAALAAAPGYAEARIAAANSAIAAGDLDIAVAICDQGLAVAPADAGLFRTRG
ncbi:MAG: tetratricopeptide repeat protein, partial [Casimicrobiaceae bacterium]